MVKNTPLRGDIVLIEGPDGAWGRKVHPSEDFALEVHNSTLPRSTQIMYKKLLRRHGPEKVVKALQILYPTYENLDQCFDAANTDIPKGLRSKYKRLHLLKVSVFLGRLITENRR